MNFIDLFSYLENRLGYHKFPVNTQAGDLPELFDSSATHHDLVVKLAHKIYKANHCQKLQSPVQQEKVEQVLSLIRVEILDGKRTDIDLYHFIEEICVVVYEYFTRTEVTGDDANPRESQARKPG